MSQQQDAWYESATAYESRWADRWFAWMPGRASARALWAESRADRGRDVTKRDLNRQHKHDEMVGAGLDKLAGAPIEMLRSALNASALGVAAGVPKDTAYRVFRSADPSSADPVLRAVSRAAADPSWAGFDESLTDMARAFDEVLRAEIGFEEAIVASMAANVEAQFQAPGGPVGWLLHATAITASERWKGPVALSDRDAAIARELLDDRAMLYAKVTDELAPILAATLSLLGRRPKAPLDVRGLVSLMHALIDGAVLRLYVEPDAFSARLVGEAILALALAFSEEGYDSDPRCPADEAGRVLYDTVVGVARASWPSGAFSDVRHLAGQAGVDPEMAVRIFPSVADVADSVMWRAVLAGGSLEAGTSDGQLQGSEGELSMLFALLRRVRILVDELPGVGEVLSVERPALGPGVRGEFERQGRGVLALHCPGVDPLATIDELVRAALGGSHSWPAAEVLMRVLLRSSGNPEGVPL